jgi:proteinaceous RNase P
LLVSNDELRDHIFSLLRPKHFLKWKARHIAHYSFTPDASAPPVLTYPAPYTSCVQQLPNGAWMFPRADGGPWLCAKPTA